MNKKLVEELCKELKKHNIDFDNGVGILLTLKIDENYEKMLDWLKENLQASEEDIFAKLDEMEELS